MDTTTTETDWRHDEAHSVLNTERLLCVARDCGALMEKEIGNVSPDFAAGLTALLQGLRECCRELQTLQPYRDAIHAARRDFDRQSDVLLQCASALAHAVTDQSHTRMARRTIDSAAREALRDFRSIFGKDPTSPEPPPQTEAQPTGAAPHA